MQTFAIITTAVNTLMAPIHEGMPAILEGDELALWRNQKTAASDLPALLAAAAEGPAPGAASLVAGQQLAASA